MKTDKRALLNKSLTSTLDSMTEQSPVEPAKKAAFTVEERWLKEIEKEAYWETKNFGDVVNAALKQYFTSKTAMKDIPAEALALINRRKRKK